MTFKWQNICHRSNGVYAHNNYYNQTRWFRLVYYSKSTHKLTATKLIYLRDSSSSFVCHGSPLPVISAPPLTLYSFLYSSHISLQILTSFFSSESLAILIAFSHWPAAYALLEAIKNIWRTNHTAVRTKKRVLFSMKGKVSVYKKESVRWPE